MTDKNALNLAKNTAKVWILSGLFIAALSFLLLVVTQKNFKATTDLLVVQNQNGFTDYYALSKSADFLTSVLVESTYSEKFLDEVNNTNIITASFLSGNKADRLKEWEKVVKISRNPNLGMIHIEVFASNQTQATEISNAVISVLTNKNFLFLGKGQDLDVRVLNGPLWEKNPSVADITMSVAGGFAVGALLALVWVYYRNESAEDLIKKYRDMETGRIVAMKDEYIESLESLS